MSALSEAMGGDAPPHLFEHDGKTYRVKLIDFDLQQAIEKRIFQQARDILRMTKEDYSPEEYSTQLAMQNTAYQTGEFAFASERGQRYLKTNAGVLAVAALAFQTTEDDMQRLLLARAADVAGMLARVFRESFKMSDEQRADAEKKAKEAEAKAAATPPAAPKPW